MSCPLCGRALAKYLLLTSVAVSACPAESCVYPFNLSMEELQRQMLLVPASEAEIMAQMRDKLVQAEVDPKISEFMTKDELP